jgi:hypothetical protein
MFLSIFKLVFGQAVVTPILFAIDSRSIGIVVSFPMGSLVSLFLKVSSEGKTISIPHAF